MESAAEEMAVEEKVAGGWVEAAVEVAVEVELARSTCSSCSCSSHWATAMLQVKVTQRHLNVVAGEGSRA